MKNVKLVLVVFYIFCFFSTNLAQKYDVQQLKSKYLSLESNLLKSKQNLKETFVSQGKNKKIHLFIKIHFLSLDISKILNKNIYNSFTIIKLFFN